MRRAQRGVNPQPQFQCLDRTGLTQGAEGCKARQGRPACDAVGAEELGSDHKQRGGRTLDPDDRIRERDHPFFLLGDSPHKIFT